MKVLICAVIALAVAASAVSLYLLGRPIAGPRAPLPRLNNPETTRENPLTLVLVPIADPRQQVRNDVEAALKEHFQAEVKWAGNVEMPKLAYYPPRRRFRADSLIKWLHEQFALESSQTKFVGVTEKDISTTAHGVKDYGVMGLAYIGGKTCVVSSYRSKRRIGRVAVHEAGHTLGLEHCPEKGCLMQDGEGTGRNIRSSTEFCRACAKRIDDWLR